MTVSNEVTISEVACVGCGACVELCPPDVLRLSDAGTAYAAYPDDCEGCYICQIACAFHAVAVSVVLDRPTRSFLQSLQ